MLPVTDESWRHRDLENIFDMKIIDKYLNEITMYKLTWYYLLALVGIASALGFLHVLPISGYDILLNAIVASLACYFANIIFAKLFKAVTNSESALITALIIVLIFPVKFPYDAPAFAVLSFLAMGSKYLLTVEKRHLFNPAAVAVLMLSLLSPERAATWWIGTPSMLIPVLIGGFLLVRKIRRTQMVVVFFITFFIVSALATLTRSGSLASIYLGWQNGLLISAVAFFAFVMFTEPLTSPPTKKLQTIFAIIVGILYSTPLLRIGLVLTPEMALVIGNIFSFIVSPKYRLILPLLEKIKVSPDTYVFVFEKIPKFSFVPGQYMEWTLPHNQVDSRGNRRYFSICSAPHENLMMAVKFYTPPSSYKRALLDVKQGTEIVAASLAGDFVLPKDKSKKLVFIAGGVGIAPFRSILEDIIEKKEKVDIIVIFANKRVEDIIFKNTLKQAYEFGVKTHYVLTDKEAVPTDWDGLVGHLSEESIKQMVPDYKNRLFYVSGPQLMVQNFEKILLTTGVSKKNLKLDFFPGYIETTA